MLILKVISPWFSIDKDNDETNFPPEVCLLPHSDSVHTPHLHLVHPVDVVDGGVEKDDANLTSEVGLELPEETAAVEAIQGGFRGTASPDLAWCASTSSCTDILSQSSLVPDFSCQTSLNTWEWINVLPGLASRRHTLVCHPSSRPVQLQLVTKTVWTFSSIISIKSPCFQICSNLKIACNYYSFRSGLTFQKNVRPHFQNPFWCSCFQIYSTLKMCSCLKICSLVLKSALHWKCALVYYKTVTDPASSTLLLNRETSSPLLIMETCQPILLSSTILCLSLAPTHWHNLDWE